MDPIIRSAPVSPLARQIGRQARQPAPVAATSAPAATPANPVPATATAAAAAPLRPAAGLPAMPTALTPPAQAAAAAPSAASIRLEATLRERDAEIAQLRAQTDKIKADLTAIQADAERKGYAAGEAKGEKAARDLLQAQAERLKSLVVQLGQARRQVMDEAEDAMLDLVHGAICRILGEQGATRDTVQRLVRDAAASVRDELTVRLHPDDAALLRAAGEIGEAGPRVVADATVKLGGCIVDSATGSLDARFETQLELLGAALLTVRAGRHSGEDTL